jgi:hypothetical protein
MATPRKFSCQWIHHSSKVRALVGRRLCLHKLNNILNQWQLQIGLGTIVRLAGTHAAMFSSGDVEAHDSSALHMPYVRSHLRLARRALRREED